MSSVYGRKVKEPKVTTRENVQFRRDKAAKQAEGKKISHNREPIPLTFLHVSDLQQAWANFGEAKTVVSVWEGVLSSR